jgi:hypothetical protein
MPNKAKESYGDLAKNVIMPEKIQRQLDTYSLEFLLKQAGKAITPVMVKKLNLELNSILKNDIDPMQ